MHRIGAFNFPAEPPANRCSFICRRSRFFSFCLAWALWAGFCGSATGATAPPLLNPEEIREAFRVVHQGWSVDELLLQDQLGDAFLAACIEKSGVDAGFFDDAAARATFDHHCRAALLRLRKQGKLQVPTTHRAPLRASDPSPDRYLHLAEMAARTVSDQFEVNVDQVLMDRRLLSAFDEQALALAGWGELGDLSPYLLRKAALQLRKQRQLRPELLARVTDWGRVVSVHPLRELEEDIERVPAVPGIYLFRSPEGYLYIGEAANLRRRIAQHLKSSDRAALANYLKAAGNERISIELHAFAPDSPARRTSYRRAYESELIASREPQLNVRP